MTNNPYTTTRIQTGNGDAVLGKVNVLLGANGSGKSWAIQWLKADASHSHLQNKRPVVYVEGGRKVGFNHAISLSEGTYHQIYSTEQSARERYKAQQFGSVEERIREIFYYLIRKDAELRNRHSDAANEWEKSGKQGAYPSREEKSFDILFRIMSGIFPDISFNLVPTNNQFTIECRKPNTPIITNQPYGIANLSDGERQCLFLVADILIAAEKRSLFLIDEPELNLHPNLANQFWTMVENQFPDSIFVYATHSISFALRENVDKIFVLSGMGKPALEISSLNDIPLDQKREFLGAIPGILNSSAAIAIEGDVNSFDESFYRWIIGDKHIALIPLSGCKDVEAATKKTGVWEQLAPDARVIGIVDKDYRIADSQSDACLVLDYHEAESYLCDPKIIVALASNLMIKTSLPTEDEITALIKDFYFETRLKTIARTVGNQLRFSLDISIERKILSKIKNEEDLRTAFHSAAKRKINGVIAATKPKEINKVFDKELKRNEDAEKHSTIEKILEIVEGKELLKILAQHIGLPDSSALLNTARHHLQVENFKGLKKLRERILKALQN